MNLKRKLAEALLDAGLSMPVGGIDGAVKIVAIADSPGMDVPESAKPEMNTDGTARVIALNFSYRFVPRSLVVDVFGLTQLSSFGATKHICRIPWAAIGMLRVDGIAVCCDVDAPAAVAEPNPRRHLQPVD